MISASADSFREWGAMAHAYDSPLYSVLVTSIAEDSDLLALAAHTAPGQPAPNMIMGASHFLLMNQPAAPLRRFYMNLTENPLPPEGAAPAFREFCLDNREAIIEILQTRRTQTNATRRCTFLLPAFQKAANYFGGRPFAQLEIGCSAGLLLNWDRFGYRYASPQGDKRLGNLDSPVQLKTELRGDGRPGLGEIPIITERIGVDINPIDVTDRDEANWLDALIWPELVERRALLQAAIETMQEHPVELVAADGIAGLAELAARFPTDVPLLVFHSVALYQVSAELRQQFLVNLGQLAQEREVVCVSAEWLKPAPTPQLHIHSWQDGQRTTTQLANMDAHGRWLEWLF